MPLGEVPVAVMRAIAGGLSIFGKSHVWLIFYKDLHKPLVGVPATVPITITPASPADAGEMAAMWKADAPHERSASAQEAIFLERFRDGSACCVARLNGRIVAYDWIRPWTAVGAAGVPMVMADGEVYTTDAYTAEAWRGHRIHPALNHAILKRVQDGGFRIAYTMARANNAQSLPTLRRIGWTLSGALLVFQPRWAPDSSWWFVRGSPYPMPVGRFASAAVPSLAEFYKQQQYDGQELLHALPWSDTLRLYRGEESFLLTIVPREHAAKVRVASTVARAWPKAVPPVVACNYAFESWMLTSDPGGTRLAHDSPQPQLMTMLEAYAALQAAAVARVDVLKQLPAASLDALVNRLMEFLEHDSDGDSERDGMAGAAFFLGQEEAQRLRDVFDRSRRALERHLEPARRLPLTLNHGRLEPASAALQADGSCALLDWTCATSGPAGLSLHGIVGSCLPATVLLVSDANVLLDHYLKALAQGAYAHEDLLRECLPASITAGLILEILRLGGYPMEDPAQRQLVSECLRSRFKLLLELCEGLQPADGSTAQNLP